MRNDLISRSALLEWVINQKAEATGVYGNIIAASIDAVMKHNVANAIRKAPAVDAEPVRHGRWIHCKGKSNLWYCSECGEQINYNPTRRTYKPVKKPVQEVNKRCRNCSAKMDGDTQCDSSKV